MRLNGSGFSLGGGLCSLFNVRRKNVTEAWRLSESDAKGSLYLCPGYTELA